MKDRIRQIMESLHMTQQVFADYIGQSTGTISGIFTGRTHPSMSVVTAIKTKIPDINTDWLIFGKGEMFDTPASNKTAGESSESSPFAPQASSAGSAEAPAFFVDDAEGFAGGAAVGVPAVGGPSAGVPSAMRGKAAQRGSREQLLDFSGLQASGGQLQRPYQGGAGRTNGQKGAAAVAPGAANVVAYYDRPQRKVTEIRVYYDDQTWESFVPSEGVTSKK